MVQPLLPRGSLVNLVEGVASGVPVSVIVTAVAGATVGTTTSVASALASTVLLAANTNRNGAIIINDSNSRLYVKYGAAASITSHAARLEAHDYLEVPFGYTGVIEGIWAPNVSGSARVTELT